MFLCHMLRYFVLPDMCLIDSTSCLTVLESIWTESHCTEVGNHTMSSDFQVSDMGSKLLQLKVIWKYTMYVNICKQMLTMASAESCS